MLESEWGGRVGICACASFYVYFLDVDIQYAHTLLPGVGAGGTMLGSEVGGVFEGQGEGMCVSEGREDGIGELDSEEEGGCGGGRGCVWGEGAGKGRGALGEKEGVDGGRGTGGEGGNGGWLGEGVVSGEEGAGDGGVGGVESGAVGREGRMGREEGGLGCGEGVVLPACEGLG